MSNDDGWTWFRGEFATWELAASGCGSYAAPAILERVTAASRLVRDGAAAYERDGFAFAEPRTNGPLVTALRRARSGSGRLHVLDFGGALGSLYWQHRGAFPGDARLDWRVVEQDSYVVVGRREFRTPTLSFWDDLGRASDAWPVDVAILSSVLQYLPAPHAVLRSVLSCEASFVFLDRLPLIEGAADRLTIEQVPPDIGTESYPAWFLSESRLLGEIEERYDLDERFATRLENDAPEAWHVFGRVVPNQGFLFRRRSAPSTARR